jgi:hypothetical protein
MPKKKFEDEDDVQPSVIEDDKVINQEDLTDEDISEIRDSLEGSHPSEDSNKKFVTGIRPNPPPKKSWWDVSKVKVSPGTTLVPKTWNNDSKHVCRVCCPGKDENTYWVKFSETTNETLIDIKDYKVAPEGTEYIPYMDEYTKWKYNQSKKKKT